jgi:hypothetical protein
VNIFDVDGSNGAMASRFRRGDPNVMVVFVSPLPLCNVTEQLPVSASDVRRVRKAATGGQLSPLVDASTAAAAAAEAASAGAEQQALDFEASVDFGSGGRRGTFFGISSVYQQQQRERVDAGIDADIVAVDAAAVFELTKAKHHVTQKLLLALHSAPEVGVSQRVSIARVLRVLGCFLGV